MKWPGGYAIFWFVDLCMSRYDTQMLVLAIFCHVGVYAKPNKSMRCCCVFKRVRILFSILSQVNQHTEELSCQQQAQLGLFSIISVKRLLAWSLQKTSCVEVNLL